MPVYRLGKTIVFPPPEHAEDGLLAVGGDLSVERLLAAYRNGIFPWYNDDEPILWHSPEERAVITPASLHVSKRLERTLRSGRFRVTADTAFRRVIAACAQVPRPGQDGTWINRDIQQAYTALHEAGYAHSIEVWEGNELAGGLYGVSLGTAFCGESMFSYRTDASKVALVTLVRRGDAHGIDLYDCQMQTPHLASLGARAIPRAEFIPLIRKATARPTWKGPWTGDFA